MAKYPSTVLSSDNQGPTVHKVCPNFNFLCTKMLHCVCIKQVGALIANIHISKISNYLWMIIILCDLWNSPSMVRILEMICIHSFNFPTWDYNYYSLRGWSYLSKMAMAWNNNNSLGRLIISTAAIPILMDARFSACIY